VRSQRSFASEHSRVGGKPVRTANRSGPKPSAMRAASSPARSSCHAIDGTTGTPFESSSTPVSAMLHTPTASARASARSSASAATVRATAASSAGSASAPVGTVRHGVGRDACATSAPSSVTAAAFVSVVPTSTPTSTSRLIGGT
jgi:hypothetical protein